MKQWSTLRQHRWACAGCGAALAIAALQVWTRPAADALRTGTAGARPAALFWSALATLAALLFAPGVALLTSPRMPRVGPALATALLPLPGVALLGGTGLLLWLAGAGHVPRLGWWLPAATVLACTLWTVRNLRGGGELRVHRIALLAYAGVVAAGIGYALLPAEVRGDFFERTSMRGRMAASPPDSAIPFYTASFLLHREDPRAEAGPYFWGWSYASRGPLVAWMDAAALDVVGLLPDGPPTGEPSRLVDRQGYFATRIVGILTNALVVLAAAALLEVLGANPAFGVAWVAVCPGTFLNVSFTWPKLFSAFFCLLALALARGGGGRRLAVAGACTGLGYLAHPVGVFLAPSVLLLAATRWAGAVTTRDRLRRFALVAAVAAVTVAPWIWYGRSLGHPNLFARYPLGDGRGLAPALNVFTWLRARWDNVAMTLLPLRFLFSDNMTSWQGAAVDGRTRWALQAAKSLPGQLGLALFWLAYLRVARPVGRSGVIVRDLAILLPLAAMILVWGYNSDGLGRACLEPLTPLVIVYAAAQQVAFGKRERLLLVAAAAETLSVAVAQLR